MREIRGPVWLVALGSAVLCATWLAYVGAVPALQRARRDVPAVAAAPRSTSEAPAAETVSLPPQVPHEPQAEHRAAESLPAPVAVQRADAPRFEAAPSDSRLAADIGVLEEEAARAARDLGLPLPGAATPGATEPGARTGSSATERRDLADAFLVDHLVQEAYRGTEYPLGYPAVEREHEAAWGRVRGLSPERRLGLLTLALEAQRAGVEHVEPTFLTNSFWQGLFPSAPPADESRP